MFDYVVGRIGKDGTGQVALANGSAAAQYFPNAIALDDTDVFWASVAGIHQCKKVGCANTPIDVIDDNGTGNYSPAAIGVDATTIYFVNQDSNTNAFTIMKVPKGAANGTVTTLVPATKLNQTINHMILYGTYLYFTCNDGTVGRATTASGTIENLSAAGAPAGADRFVSNGTNIYYGEFVEQATIYAMPITADAASTPLALTQAYVNGMDMDTQYLYWADVGVSLDNGAGTVLRCSLSQCTPQTLASSIDIPTDLAVDNTSIFWAANGNGDTPNTGVWRLTKPP